MKDILRELKWNSILLAVLYVALGVLLLVFPQTSARTLCWLLGAVALVAGVCTVVLYVLRDITENFLRNDLVSGLLEIGIGVFLFWKTDFAISLAPVLVGVVVLISGLAKIQAAVDMARLRCQGWWVALVLAVLSLVLGVLLLVDPFDSVTLLFQMLGVGLIYSGVSDGITTVLLSRRIKNFVRGVKETEAEVEIEGRDVTPQA